MATVSRRGASALLDLPATPGKSALKAGLVAMRVDAVPAQGLPQSVARLQDDPNCVLVADISAGPQSSALTLLQLNAAVPAGDLRRRILLTRLASGHVSSADRQWVRSLGFGGLWGDFNPLDPEGELRQAVDLVADAVGVAKLPAPELARYVRVLNTDRAPASPRATVWTITAMSAEVLAASLLENLDIRDRSYHLRPYPQCFVGSEAAQWTRAQFKCSRDEAVAVGQALGKLGLLVHVTHDHPFLDEGLFYRVVDAPPSSAIDLGAAHEVLTDSPGVEVGDREYLGSVFTRCWVGSEAVDLVAARFGTGRLDAWLAITRLAQFGLVEHVSQARPIADGNYFYRFVGADIPETSPPQPRSAG